jgi:5'-nucleotidase
MRILISNDDGLKFPGLLRLRERLEAFGETWVFAPAEEKSATSMALSIHTDVPVIRLDERTFEVDAFPVDCVNVALHSGLAPQFDFCVSGINKGVNMGQDIWYSGTVGAARHTFIHGVPSFAVSCGYLDASGDFARSQTFLVKFCPLQRRCRPEFSAQRQYSDDRRRRGRHKMG